MAWIIYGKSIDSHRCMRPLDLANGVFVNNIMHASVWWNDQEDEARKACKHLQEHNRDYIFEVRKKGN